MPPAAMPGAQIICMNHDPCLPESSAARQRGTQNAYGVPALVREVRVTIGEPSNGKIPCRDVCYSVSFVNDSGDELRREREVAVFDEILRDPHSVAWTVAGSIRDLILENGRKQPS
jgi:hypothetical protein